MKTLPQKEYEDRTFGDLTSGDDDLKSGIYRRCIFERCDFSERDFTDAMFDECTFRSCTFTLTKMHGSRLRQVTFTNCKLAGIDFTQCNTFLMEFGFEQCKLDGCTFSNLKVQGMVFRESSILNCDFFGADLTGADFSDCNFRRSIFGSTNLSKADFSGAKGYTINPVENKLKGAVFTLPDAMALLSDLGIVIKS